VDNWYEIAVVWERLVLEGVCQDPPTRDLSNTTQFDNSLHYIVPIQGILQWLLRQEHDENVRGGQVVGENELD
jgi:hypothetical protein